MQNILKKYCIFSFNKLKLIREEKANLKLSK